MKAAAAQKTQGTKAPDPKAPAGAVVRRFQRPTDLRIKEMTDDVRARLPIPFAGGTHYLRRVPCSQQEAAEITTVAEGQQLLQTEYLVMTANKTVKDGISAEQRRRHLYLLYDLLEIIQLKQNDTQFNNRVSTMFISALDQLAKHRFWGTPTTKSTMACCLYGALERLPQYTGVGSILLDAESEWRDAMLTMIRATAGHSPTRAEVTKEGLQAAVMKGTTAAATLLLLAWSTSGRPWSMFAVKQDDLVLTPVNSESKPIKGEEKVTGYRCRVTFRDHKVVKKKGAFTTHTWLPAQLGEIVLAHLAETKHQYVFPKLKWHPMMTEVKDLLKEQDPSWDLKCLRRGCLATQGRSGVPIDVIMRSAAHSNVATTMRYLSWGQHAGVYADAGAAAATTLFDAVLPTSHSSIAA
jgi:hypothetical protein